jgi:hypothetical protein
MSFFRDAIIPTPVYPCAGGSTGAADARAPLTANMNGTVYQFVRNYEATTGKKYRFKSNEERMRYMVESMRPENCVVE